MAAMKTVGKEGRVRGDGAGSWAKRRTKHQAATSRTSTKKRRGTEADTQEKGNWCEEYSRDRGAVREEMGASDETTHRRWGRSW